MDEQETRKFFMNELDKREKIQEEKIREMIKTEIKKAERRKEAKERRKDPSSYQKRCKEVK